MSTLTISMEKETRSPELKIGGGFVSSWVGFVRYIVINVMEKATTLLSLPAKVWHILPVSHLSIPFGLRGSGGHVGRKELQEIANVQEKKRRESEGEEEQEAKPIQVEETEVTLAREPQELNSQKEQVQEEEENDTGGPHVIVPAFTTIEMTEEEEPQMEPQGEEDDEVEYGTAEKEPLKEAHETAMSRSAAASGSDFNKTDAYPLINELTSSLIVEEVFLETAASKHARAGVQDEIKSVDMSSIHTMEEMKIIAAKSPNSTKTEISDVQEDSDIQVEVDAKRVSLVRKHSHEELHVLTKRRKTEDYTEEDGSTASSSMGGAGGSTQSILGDTNHQAEEEDRELKQEKEEKEYTDLNLSEALNFMPFVESAIFS